MTLVKELMTENLFTLAENHPLDLAKDMMDWKNIRHIPVVDHGNHLVGLITHRDLLKAAMSSLTEVSKEDRRDHFRHHRVSELMQKEILTAGPDMPIKKAAQLMRDNRVGCLPVVDRENVLKGIITEADFLTLSW